MRSVWHRSGAGVAVRIGILLLLIAALLMSLRGTIVSDSTVPDDAAGRQDRTPAVDVSASTQHARPGQTIGIRIAAAADSNTDIVMMANDNIIAEQPLPLSGILNLTYQVPDSGPVIFGVELRNRIDQQLLVARPAAELVNIAMATEILVLSERPSAYAQSLREGGWAVTNMAPTAFAGQPATLNNLSMLVLDDVPIAGLAPQVWLAIDTAVRAEGMGLLVLGGPNSFTLGAYRESLLENLLPVISEPPDYEPPASVLFLVDVSGSMDRPGRLGNRLQIARQAVVETSQALRKIDHVGLMSFDIEFREHLPLSSRSQHGDAVAQSWPEAASGGTRMVPAISDAIERLEADEHTQDILVVVTDGGASQDDLDELSDVLEATEVSVIALIISEAGDLNAESLKRLFEINSNTAVRIDDVLQLPALMRSEVEKNRPAVVEGPLRLSVDTSTSWLPAMSDALEVDRYLLTRPRKEATVQLRSPRGDVIMASIGVGAGEVIAVTSGFSEWASDWLLSADWPPFAANLARRLSTRDKNDLEINVIEHTTDSATLVVDQTQREFAQAIAATLISPSGVSVNLRLSPSAPGQLSAALPLPEGGEYLVKLDDGISTLQHSFIASTRNAGIAADIAAASVDPFHLWSRRLVCLGLILFLGVLIWERR